MTISRRHIGSASAGMGKHYRWYRSRLLRHLCDFDPLANFLVCAGPRSGSTWLAELIALAPRTALLFEPLMPTEPTPFRDLGFASDQMIPEDASWPEAKAAFHAMLRGKTITDWNITYSRSSALSFMTARQMVVKFCHANALLPWLVRNFRFQYVPVFLVRHPFAVVASEVERPKWNHEFHGFRSPECPFSEHYLRHERFLSGLATKEEALVAEWCLSNCAALQRSANGGDDWITVYYEHLLQDPVSEVTRVFDHWRVPLPKGVARSARKPSMTVYARALRANTEEQLTKWKHNFSSDQLCAMTKVLEYFRITVYGDDPLPQTSWEAYKGAGRGRTAPALAG